MSVTVLYTCINCIKDTNTHPCHSGKADDYVNRYAHRIELLLVAIYAEYNLLTYCCHAAFVYIV